MSDAFTPRNLGFAMLGVAAIALVSAALITWHAIDRWRGVAALRQYHMLRLEGQLGEAKTAARTAAGCLPSQPATVLSAIDPASEADRNRLDLLLRQAEPRHRGLVRTAMAFSDVVRGKAPGETAEGSDGILLETLARLNRGEPAPAPALSRSDPPHRSLLAHALQRLVQEHWKAGNRDGLRDTAMRLLMLEQRHPDRARLLAVSAALDPGTAPDRLSSIASGITADAGRTAFLRRLSTLAPERRDVLLRPIPESERTPEEKGQALLAGNATLDQQVSALIGRPEEGTMRVLAARCLDQGRLDLLKRLAEAAPGALKGELASAVALAEGDVAALLKALPQRTDLAPRATPPLIRSGMIAFHLTTAQGLIPRRPELAMRVDDRVVLADRITRFGSLVMIDMGDETNVTLDVRMGDLVVINAQVQP